MTDAKTTIRIADLVRDGKVARFAFCRDGSLWYKTESGFEFPVPLLDIGDATFNAEEKALLLMRYIRKHLESIEAAREEQSRA